MNETVGESIIFTYNKLIDLLKTKDQSYHIRLKYDDTDGYGQYYDAYSSIISYCDYTTEITTVAEFITELKHRSAKYGTNVAVCVLSNLRQIYNIKRVITKTMEYPDGTSKGMIIFDAIDLYKNK